MRQGSGNDKIDFWFFRLFSLGPESQNPHPLSHRTRKKDGAPSWFRCWGAVLDF